MGACFGCRAISHQLTVLSIATYSTRDIPVFAQAPTTWKRENLMCIKNLPEYIQIPLTR